MVSDLVSVFRASKRSTFTSLRVVLRKTVTSGRLRLIVVSQPDEDGIVLEG